MPQLVPLAPAGGVGAQPFNPQTDPKARAMADQKFSQWYGSLPQDQVSQFSPKTDTFTFNGKDAHAQGVSQRSPDELAAAQRYNARMHFNANVLPYDSDYNAMRMAPAPTRSLVPLAPATNARTTTKYDAAGNSLGSTVVTGSTTPPKPGVPIGKQISGVIDAGRKLVGTVADKWTNAARVAETSRHNKEMEGQGQQRIDANAAKPVGPQPHTDTTSFTLDDAGQVTGKQTSRTYGVAPQNTGTGRGGGNLSGNSGPSTQPNPTTAPALLPATQPFNSAQAPQVPPPANRGGIKIPQGFSPLMQGHQYIEGRRYLMDDGTYAIYKEPNTWLKVP